MKLIEGGAEKFPDKDESIKFKNPSPKASKSDRRAADSRTPLNANYPIVEHKPTTLNNIYLEPDDRDEISI